MNADGALATLIGKWCISLNGTMRATEMVLFTLEGRPSTSRLLMEKGLQPEKPRFRDGRSGMSVGGIAATCCHIRCSDGSLAWR